MTPTKLRERLSELEGRVDPETYVRALEYVHEDGRSERPSRRGPIDD